MGPKIQIKQTFRFMLIALGLAITAIMFFAPTSFAADPIYNPGNSNFPFQSGGTRNPNNNFPYANVGLEKGLDIAAENLPGGVQREDSFVELVKAWINYFLQFYIFVAVGIIIYFGVQILLSRDKTDKRKEAITAIINIAIGTLLIFFAYAIVIAIVNLVSLKEFKTNTGAIAPSASTPTQTNNLYGSAPTITAGDPQGISRIYGSFYTEIDSVLHWNIAIPAGGKVVGYQIDMSNDNFATKSTIPDSRIRSTIDYNASFIGMYFVAGEQTKLLSFPYKKGSEYRFKVTARILLADGTYTYFYSEPGIIK